MLAAVHRASAISVAHFSLAAALAHLGRIEEAQSPSGPASQLNPGFTISRVPRRLGSDERRISPNASPLYEGMRKAGVPEQ